MQRLAAYLLERNEDLQWPEARNAEGERIVSVVEAWLKEKGAASVSGEGAYAALDGSDAKFAVLRAVDGDRWWRMFELTEVSEDGRRFGANVSVTVGQKDVVVFVTLEVGSVATQINRIEVDPRCPKVVRDLLADGGTWYHGSSRFRGLTRVNGFDAGEALALELQHFERTIPFVVLSAVDGELTLRGLDEALEYDLAGVANVARVDDAASWALTDTLRTPFSCYSGALRIYWPRLSREDEPFRHQLWTASRLRGLDGSDEHLALERVRRQVRTIIMRASAASVVRPAEIDEIRGAASRAELLSLKERASSLEDFKALADSYSTENDNLRRDLAARVSELEALRGEAARLAAERQALLFHLGQAKTNTDGAEIETDLPKRDEGDQPPKSGEVRHYKKKYAAPTHDVFVRVNDCGHNSWQNAAKADKAKKGIAKLEGDQLEWRTLQHCGSCTGPGMWRVQW